MSDIEGRLLQAKCEYIQKTGDGPTCIYLGRDEHNALVEQLLKFEVSVYAAQVFPLGEHFEWYGMKVFEVLVKSHVGFGMGAPS
jgi:hypothetical protein